MGPLESIFIRIAMIGMSHERIQAIKAIAIKISINLFIILLTGNSNGIETNDTVDVFRKLKISDK